MNKCLLNIDRIVTLLDELGLLLYTLKNECLCLLSK